MGPQEFRALLVQDAQEIRKHSNKQGLNIVGVSLIVWNVPREMVPDLAAALALVRCPYPLPDISLANVNRNGAVIQNVNPLAACATPWYFFNVLDRKSTRLNSSHIQKSRMPSSA